MADLSNIWRFDLRRGNSPHPSEGACLLDAVSFFEYGTLGDHPACVCPVVAPYGRRINDVMPHAERQRLRAYIPRLAGTVDPAAKHLRAEAIVRHTVRVVLPLLAETVRQPDVVAKLRALPAGASMAEVRVAADKARGALATAAADYTFAHYPDEGRSGNELSRALQTHNHTTK